MISYIDDWYNIDLFLFIRMNKMVTLNEIKKKFPLVSEMDLKKLMSLGKIEVDREFYMAV